MKKINLKKLTVPQLIKKAYYEEDEDIYTDYIFELRKRGNSEILNLIRDLVYSKDAIYREIAGGILSQFAYKTKSFKGERIYLLGRLLDDKNEDVISSAIYGFGHIKATLYGDKLASFATSKSLDIKRALAFALGGYENKKAIEALILLMNDDDFDTRNWATFSLAQICESDTPAIRDTLYKNLNDIESEVRGEALLGLATRKDTRVINAILEDLQSDFYGSWIFSAIVKMPDKRYLQYFDKYINSLHEEDRKAFDLDIKEAREALREVAKRIAIPSVIEHIKKLKIISK